VSSKFFPTALLKPLAGQIIYLDHSNPGPTANSWSIVIPVAPFSADTEFSLAWRSGTQGPYVVSTQIVLEFIHLPAEDLLALAGRSFRFPINPAEGYIDGSMYLGGAHNPVDVTQIDFGELQGTTIAAKLVCDFIFDYELRRVGNAHADLVTMLSFSPGSATFAVER
jgi:hypothetical protein